MLRKALLFSQLPLKSEEDAGLTLAHPALKFTDSLCLVNVTFTSGSSFEFSTSITNFEMISCSASWIALVFTQLANSSSSMAQSLTSEGSIFDLEGMLFGTWRVRVVNDLEGVFKRISDVKVFNILIEACK